jgi:sulfate/thiosulfate transport system ATP-binding protein
MAIDAVNVNKRFGDFVALHDVTLRVPDGSLTALLGPSGCGKSTLLRIVAGLERPNEGQVTIGDRDVTQVPARERGVGMVFQHYAAFKHMTVAQNVAFGLRIRKKGRKEIAARVDELLGLVHLGGWSERYPHQLSGGQRQRMALARALAVEPEVLLLDEPFGALDAQVRRELREWLRRLHDEVHVTTVIVTHDREEAMEVADRILVMRDGRVEQEGSPDEIYEQPASPWVMEFLGPVTKLGQGEARPHDIEVLLETEPGAEEAIIERVLRLGFEVRIEAALGDGSPVLVQLSRAEAEPLELKPGDIVWLRRTTEARRNGAGPELVAPAVGA